MTWIAQDGENTVFLLDSTFHVDVISWHSSCGFQVHSPAASLFFCQVLNRSAEPWRTWRRTVNSSSCSRGDFCFMLEAGISRWMNCGHGRMQSVLRKTFPTASQHLHQPGLFTRGRLGPWICIPHSDPAVCVPQQKSTFIRQALVLHPVCCGDSMLTAVLMFVVLLTREMPFCSPQLYRVVIWVTVSSYRPR